MSNDIALITVFLFLMIGSVSNLRRHNSLEIFAIWYVFSLLLLIFLALYFFAEKSSQEITDLLGPSYTGILKLIYNSLTNVSAELLLVSAFVYIGIIPQLLTYLLSGLSGSASQPRFVRQIGIAAIWMLIKFMAALSGILLARPLADLLLGKTVPISGLVQGLGFISAAFTLAFFHHNFFDEDEELEYVVLPGFRINAPARLGPGGMLILRYTLKIHDLFTRNRQKPLTPSDPEKKPERELELKALGGVLHLRGPVPLTTYYLLTRRCRRRRIYRFLARHCRRRKINQEKKQGP
jgi:hypothetical protein